MPRDFFINGETLVVVKNAQLGLQELGLSDGPIRVSPVLRHKDIKVDAWAEAPPEVQFMLSWATISMTLVHVDRNLVDSCIGQSCGGAGVGGTLVHAGSRLGNNLPSQGAGNFYLALGLTSPMAGRPWTFFNCYLTDNLEIPLGTEKSLFQLNWRCIPYIQDPYNGSAGANGYVLWNNTQLF